MKSSNSIEEFAHGQRAEELLKEAEVALVDVALTVGFRTFHNGVQTLRRKYALSVEERPSCGMRWHAARTSEVAMTGLGIQVWARAERHSDSVRIYVFD
jgi:hypothetical protein